MSELQEPLLNGIAMETKLLLHDGTIKFAHQINPGDILMGDDSTPRHVISVKKIDASQSKLYKVKQIKGENYIINRDNYISLKLSRIRNTKTNSLKINENEYTKDTVVDIRLSDYIALNNTTQLDFKGYKVAVDFKVDTLIFDPYIIGIWLVDASTLSTNEITISDPLILYECFEILQKYDMKLEFVKGNRYSINYENSSRKFNDILTSLNLIDCKCIPSVYKINSRENRMKLLAGIIDCEGFFNNNCYELTVKDEKLVDDIVFLCNSLGFYTSKSVQKNTHYYRLIISGNLTDIPVFDPRKKMSERKQIKNILHTGIKIEPLSDVNMSLEFTIDGNGRFLTSDFTVIHS